MIDRIAMHWDDSSSDVQRGELLIAISQTRAIGVCLAGQSISL